MSIATVWCLREMTEPARVGAGGHAAPGEFAVSFRALSVFLLAVIVGMAAVGVWYFATRSNSGPTVEPVSRAAPSSPARGRTPSPTRTTRALGPATIHFAYPEDWVPVAVKAIKGLPANAADVIQRTDRKAILVVIPGGKAPPLDTASAESIGASLQKQYADYKFLSAKIVRLAVGKALLFTYLRTRQGVMHTVTIIPVSATSSFLVETASPPQSGAIGKEIALILRSATVTHA